MLEKDLSPVQRLRLREDFCSQTPDFNFKNNPWKVQVLRAYLAGT